MKNLLTILFALSSAMAFAIGNYANGAELYVHAPSGLKLRSTADGETVLATIPYGTKLKVLEARKTVLPKTVDGIAGYWAKVTYDGKTGYVFDGYLSYLPTPKESCETLEQYCLDSFTKDGEKMTIAFDDSDTDGSGQTVIQLFKFKGRKAIYTETHGYEWGDEYLTISGISQEEAYLVAKYIARKRMAAAVNFYKTNKPLDFNPEVYTSYILRPEGGYLAPLSIDGCSENLSINRRAKEDIVCIKFSSYC